MARKRRAIIGYKWVGDGSVYLTSVPMRDLSASEAATFGKLIQAAEVNTSERLYEPIFAKPVSEDGEGDK